MTRRRGEITKRGEFSDMMTPYRRMVPEERRMLDESLDFVYDVFVNGVAQGRGLSVTRVRDLAQGRVYLGSQAVNLGLVDGLKGFNEVIEIAAQQAGIADDYRVLTFLSKKPSLVERDHGGLVDVSGEGVVLDLVVPACGDRVQQCLIESIDRAGLEGGDHLRGRNRLGSSVERAPHALMNVALLRPHLLAAQIGRLQDRIGLRSKMAKPIFTPESQDQSTFPE